MISLSVAPVKAFAKIIISFFLPSISVAIGGDDFGPTIHNKGGVRTSVVRGGIGQYRLFQFLDPGNLTGTVGLQTECSRSKTFLQPAKTYFMNLKAEGLPFQKPLAAEIFEKGIDTTDGFRDFLPGKTKKKTQL